MDVSIAIGIMTGCIMCLILAVYVVIPYLERRERRKKYGL